MCRPSRWLPGLIPLFLLLLAALGAKTGAIGHDLAERVAASIKGQGGPDLTVHVAGRDVRLSGHVADESDQAQALAIAESTPGVRWADGALSLPAEVKPYMFKASREGDAIRLSGLVPSAATRLALVGAAAALAPKVVDGLTIARGAPTGFQAMALAAIKPLGLLGKGEAALTDSSLSLSGVAVSAGDRVAALAALKALPAGLALGASKIDAPEERFDPSKAKAAPPADALAAAARSPQPLPPALQAPPVSAEAKVESKPAFDPSKAVAAPPLDALASATRSPQPVPPALQAPPAPAEAKVESKPAFDPSKAVAAPPLDALAAAAQSPQPLPPALQAPPAPMVSPPPLAHLPPPPFINPSGCVRPDHGLSSAGRFLFSSGSARLDESARATLRDMAATMKACAQLTAMVTGYTDNVGSADANKKLARARARSVVRVLESEGVDEKRIDWASVGESNPVANNDTAEGRAENRRIEIMVK